MIKGVQELTIYPLTLAEPPEVVMLDEAEVEMIAATSAPFESVQARTTCRVRLSHYPDRIAKKLGRTFVRMARYESVMASSTLTFLTSGGAFVASTAHAS